MTVPNAEIAELLEQFADLLEIEGASQFRVRAYRTAARNIATLPQNAAQIVSEGGDLTTIPGVGKDLAGKIIEIINTGRLSALEQLKARFPLELIQLLKIDALGPKRIKVLFEGLEVSDFDGLEEAAREQRIRALPGFGPRVEQRILEQLARLRAVPNSMRARLKWSVVEQSAEPLIASLRHVEGVVRIEAAGSYRRKQETLGHLRILAVSEDPAGLTSAFVNGDYAARIINHHETHSSIVLHSGLLAEIRIVPDADFGAAFLHSTGSDAHFARVHEIGVSRGLEISEQGIFRGNQRITARTEQEVYGYAGLPYIEPELREDRGEIEAAGRGALPSLVSIKDIRGDLHIHTSATEGRASLEQIVAAARRRGYEYLAVTDHSKRLAMVHGLDEKRLLEQIQEIDALNERLNDFLVLKGIEVDILEDGSLDLSDEVLRELDLVVCSIHHKFNLSREVQTERIVRALRHPYFMVLAHPTGRLIDRRQPYDIDLERIMHAAKDNACAFELNAQPDRLDLTDTACKMAKETGVLVAISTDAHGVAELDFMRFGVGQGRRGWLEPPDVLNARDASDLQTVLATARKKRTAAL